MPPRARPSQAPVRIISIGGVAPLKGLADGLQALAQIDAHTWEWTIVGQLESAPEHVARLRQQIRGQGLSSRVQLVGQLSHDATLAELRCSELLLLPSYTENYPLVAVEALVAGVPVVGYDVGGLPDIVRHEQTGLLAPLLDLNRLAALLARMIAEPETRQRLSRAGRIAGQSFMSWDSSARQFLVSLADFV
jgi:glycosyltransferase involved in cell wall biosynthesis